MGSFGIYSQPLAKWSAFKQKPIKVQAFVLSSSVWAIFLVYSIIYCQFYVAFIEHASSRLSESFIWALKEYGPWLLLTPCILIGYSMLWSSSKRLMPMLLVGSWVLLTAYRVSLDCLLNPDVNLYGSIVYFAPNHLAVAIFVLLGWGLVFRPIGHIKEQTVQNECLNLKVGDNEKFESLRVMKGTHEIEVAVTDITCISAAGNYMEVDVGTNTYLLRSTMKDLEARLRAHHFVRVHRSHLVNFGAIECFCNNNQVQLSSGRRLPTSRRYSRFIDNNQLVN